MFRNDCVRMWLVIAIAVSSVGLATQARAGDDTARFKGTWTTKIPYEGQMLTLASVHDGSGFKNYLLLPPGSAPIGDGAFSASDGNWTASSAAPNNSGTYHFVDDDSVMCTNAMGQSLLWQRSNVPLPPIIGATPPSAPNTIALPAGTNLAAVKVSQVIEMSQKAALAWRPDAFLVSAGVNHPNPDGTVNILVAPMQIVLLYYSPSVNGCAAISSDGAAGTFVGGPSQTPRGPLLRPISPQALDLTDAMAALRKSGFNGGVGGAQLAVWQENGKPVRLTWSLYTGEPYPRVVSAATGALLSPFEIMDDKVADYNQLAADTQAALSNARSGRGRGAFASLGIPFWEVAAARGEEPQANGSGTPNSETDTWDNEVGAQNAFDNDDPDAQARFNENSPTVEDQAAYSDGGGGE